MTTSGQLQNRQTGIIDLSGHVERFVSIDWDGLFVSVGYRSQSRDKEKVTQVQGKSKGTVSGRLDYSRGPQPKERLRFQWTTQLLEEIVSVLTVDKVGDHSGAINHWNYWMFWLFLRLSVRKYSMNPILYSNSAAEEVWSDLFYRLLGREREKVVRLI